MTQQLRGGAESIIYQVADQHVMGILYVAPGPGPHPTAILIHGIPGSEKNHDIAYALRAAGWHAFIIHVRGSWGSGGDYDILGQVDDARAAIDWLLSTENTWPMDATRIVLIGYSLGSRAAIVAATRDKRISAAISIAGVADFSRFRLDRQFFSNAAKFLRGMTGSELLRQWELIAGDGNPIEVITQLECPLLLLHGSADEIVPVSESHQLIAQAELAQIDTNPVIIQGADHLFVAHRSQLVETVVSWLTATLP